MIFRIKTYRLKNQDRIILSLRNFFFKKKLWQSLFFNRNSAYLALIALCLSCSKNPETYIEHVDGYWEIEKVVLSNGKVQDYSINLIVDYINVTDSLTGFRKKLKPNFSGTFETSKDQENFKLVIENDSLNIYYKTPFASWKETVLNANEQQLKIVNQNNDVYLYKRYIPLNLN